MYIYYVLLAMTAAPLAFAGSAVTVIIAAVYWLRKKGIESRSRLILGLHLALVALLPVVVGSIFSNVDAFEPIVRQSLSLYDPKSENRFIRALSESWDAVQRENSCCGVVSHKDWVKRSMAYGYSDGVIFSHGVFVPESCCDNLGPEDVETCRQHPSLKQFEDRMGGCFVALQKLIHDNETSGAVIVGSVVFLYFCLHIGIIITLDEVSPGAVICSGSSTKVITISSTGLESKSNTASNLTQKQAFTGANFAGNATDERLEALTDEVTADPCATEAALLFARSIILELLAAVVKEPSGANLTNTIRP